MNQTYGYWGWTVQPGSGGRNWQASLDELKIEASTEGELRQLVFDHHVARNR